MNTEIQTFESHVTKKGLKHSQKRDVILQEFLKAQQHVSVEDLFARVRKKYPTIGFTTVYRAMKLMVESGVAETVDFDDGVRRYERRLGRECHAHLICTKCGRNFEVFDVSLKGLNEKLTQENRFMALRHRFEIFGLCQKCL